MNISIVLAKLIVIRASYLFQSVGNKDNASLLFLASSPRCPFEITVCSARSASFQSFNWKEGEFIDLLQVVWMHANPSVWEKKGGSRTNAVKPHKMDSRATKKLCFKQIFVLESANYVIIYCITNMHIIIYYIISREFDFFLFKTGFCYIRVLLSQVLLYYDVLE